MVAPLVATVAVAGASLLFSQLFGGGHDFAPGACDRLEPHLLSGIVGQELAVRQAADAVCDHLAAPAPQKPLVLSAHGPPGVGKSLLHLLLARALYTRQPARALQCPGSACLGYKVLYGLDYVHADRRQQHAALTRALLEHARYHPETLLVIEEYDKLDCPTRGLLKQLIDASHSTNVTLNRSIIMLESNTGFSQLHQMLEAAGSREQVSPEAAQRLLKDLMFGLWGGSGCESAADTVKLLSLVDFFLPFLPLERRHIAQLFEARLRERAGELQRDRRGALSWLPAVVEFLTAKVDFDGPYPIEGAKEVRTLMTRYVTRALRAAEAAEDAEAAAAAAGGQAQRPRRRRRGEAPQELQLQLAPGGQALEAVRVQGRQASEL